MWIVIFKYINNFELMNVMWNLDIWETNKLLLIEIICGKGNMGIFLSSYVLENYIKIFAS